MDEWADCMVSKGRLRVVGWDEGSRWPAPVPVRVESGLGKESAAGKARLVHVIGG